MSEVDGRSGVLDGRLTRRGFWAVTAWAVAGTGAASTAACTSSASPGVGSPTSGPTPSSTGPDPDEVSLPPDMVSGSVSVAAGTTPLAIGTASGARDFHFDRATLTVATGAKVQLRFTNNTNKADEVGHNWVLVRPGSENAVVAGGKAAGDDKDWLDTEDPAIIAHSRLIEGGQTAIVRFHAPAAGSYTYLCTFPDHFAGGQKGILVVT